MDALFTRKLIARGKREQAVLIKAVFLAGTGYRNVPVDRICHRDHFQSFPLPRARPAIDLVDQTGKKHDDRRQYEDHFTNIEKAFSFMENDPDRQIDRAH